MSEVFNYVMAMAMALVEVDEKGSRCVTVDGSSDPDFDEEPDERRLCEPVVCNEDKVHPGS